MKANTLRPIQLDVQALAALGYAEFVKQLLGQLAQFRAERAAFYENLRRRNSIWANGARAVLAILGAVALFLTALVAAIRFAPNTLPFLQSAEDDKGVLVAILVIYAVMGAISFYEKGSDRTTSYFRQIATILVIRDLWTKLQFGVLKEMMELKDASDTTAADATQGRILALAEAFCVDVDKAAAGELTDFRTEFLASLTELEAVSKKGIEDTGKQIEERAKAAEKAAADAKVEAEKAANDAKVAAKAASDAGKPGFLNLSIVGEFDDEVAILVAGAEAARSRGKAIAIERVPPGPTKITARAKKGQKDLERSVIVDVKPGLQEVRVALG